MVDWCRVNRLSYVQCVVDMEAFPTFVEMAPQTIPLGLPHPYGGGRGAPGGGDCIAFRWPATREVVESIRAFGGMDTDDPMLFKFRREHEPAEMVH